MSTPGTAAALHGFTFDAPQGFVELPLEPDELPEDGLAELGASFAAVFGLDAGDENCAQLAGPLAAVGAAAGDGGLWFAAVGLFRSPDEPQRPAMILLTATAMPSDHTDPGIALTGLREIHNADPDAEVLTLDLQVGKAVAVVTEQRNGITTGEVPVPVLRRQVAAWIPDREGTTVAVVAVSTNNWQDWEHVCRLALAVFESFAWDEGQPQGGAAPANPSFIERRLAGEV
jgi:hypothetical protein